MVKQKADTTIPPITGSFEDAVRGMLTPPAPQECTIRQAEGEKAAKKR